MRVEEAFNAYAKKQFLDHRKESDLFVALDDDKLHSALSASSVTYGLANCRHIKANRTGHTAHTAGFSATGFPIGVMMQREGESNSMVYERLLKRKFGTRHGNANPNLKGLTFCSDRGYWTPTLIFSQLLQWGADIVGTVARAPFFPFVYDKLDRMKSDATGRMIVPMKGYRDVLYANLKWAGQNLRALCFRSGTGTAVSLAMSTLHQGQTFDLNSSFPADSKWYADRSIGEIKRKKNAFCVTAGENQTNTWTQSLESQSVHFPRCRGMYAGFFVACFRCRLKRLIK